MSKQGLTLLEDAIARGKAWNLPFNAIDPTGADDHFFHAKNGGNRSLMMVEIEISSTVAGNLEPFRATGTATVPAAISPISSLSGPGGADPLGTFETGVAIAMTVGDILGYFFLAANIARIIPVRYGIPPGTGIGFRWEAATGILSGHATIIELAPTDDPVKV